jgi:chromosome condensin MukBEF ATPase and DNA-binding subunit MukB
MHLVFSSVQVVRNELAQHYLSSIHQNAVINAIRRITYKANVGCHELGSDMEVDMGHAHLSSTTSTVTLKQAETCSTQLHEVYGAIDILVSGIQTLNEDTVRLSTESIRQQNNIERIQKDCAALKQGVQEQAAFFDGLKPNQEILHQEVVSLRQKLEDWQHVSYDGTLIWKITGFAEKMGTCP